MVLLLPASATASHPQGAQIGVRLDSSQRTIFYVADDGETNLVSISRSGDEYTIADDAGVGTIPDLDGAGGCAVTDSVATCPTADIDVISIEVFDLADSVFMSAAPPGGTIIDGGIGNDPSLDGGPGNDRILGGEGADGIDGHAGDDFVDTGPGDPDPASESFDEAFGGSEGGFDTLSYANRTGSIVADLEGTGVGFINDEDGKVDTAVSFEMLIGGSGDDELVGSTFADRIQGGGGSDIICGGLGVDTVDYSQSDAGVDVSLDGTLPTDPRLALPLVERPPEFSYARDDCRPVNPIGRPIAGPRDCVANDGKVGELDCVGEDIENIIGSSHDDRLVGSDPDALAGLGPRVEPLGINQLQGGGGDDLLDGRLSADSLEGGSGSDTVTYANRGIADVSASIDGASNDGAAGDFEPLAKLSDSIGPDVENIVTAAGNDTLKGDGDANRLEAGTGRDVLDGGAGGDALIAGSEGTPPVADDDTLEGGPGEDTLIAGAGDDTLAGGDGSDLLEAGDGDDLVNGGGGRDALSGGNGDDMLDYSDVTTPLFVSLDGLADDGRSSEGDNAAPDFETLLGGTDNDVLVGSPAFELLDGRAGNDVLDGGVGPDHLVGGPGADTLTYGARSGPVSVDLGAGTGAGEGGENDHVSEVEHVTGGLGDDVIVGDGNANVLDGGAGNDRVTGAGGPDQLAGQQGQDALTGDDGDDTLHGGADNDIIFGAAGTDTLDGWLGDDLLDGGAGADKMIGGRGTDTADYSNRAAAVTVDTSGSPNDGERGEGDAVNTDVESLRGGRGGDNLDIADFSIGAVDCGPGTDTAKADPSDDVASSCEGQNVQQSGVCAAATNQVRISRRGVVAIRVNCLASAKGTVQLASVGRVRVGGNKLRKLKLGSKSFTIKPGQPQTLRIKVSSTARRAIKRNKQMKVVANVRSRRDKPNAAMRTSKRTLTVKASR